MYAYKNDTGERVAKTFSNDMVAHVWAQNVQTFGQSNNGNLYFEGVRLWSYGSHFLVGILMPDNVVLLTSESHSVTTSGHKSDARAATHHMRQLDVPGLTKLDRDVFADRRRGEYVPNVELGRMAWREFDAAETRAAVIRDVAAHIATFPTISDESAVYLLTHAGLKPDAAGRRLKAIRLDVERKAKAEKLARTKAATARAIADGKAYAAMSAREFRDQMSKAVENTYYREATSWRPESTSGAIVELAKAMAVAHKAVKSRGMVRVAAIVWKRLAMVRAAKKNVAAIQPAVRRNRDRRAAISYVRQTLAAIAENRPDKFGAHASELSARALRDVAAIPYVDGRRLLDFANALDVRAAVLIEETRRAREAEHAERVRVQNMRAEERAAREAENRAAWFAGDSSVRWRGSDENGRAYIRAVTGPDGGIEGGTLQTSHGADVPLTHAVKAFRFIKLCRDTGRPWSRNGHTIRVGHFQIDRIDEHGNFTAGCHNIGWGEVERVARSLGVFELDATRDALESTHETA